MKYVGLLIVLVFIACGDGKKYHDKQPKLQSNSATIASILEFQEELNQEYKDPDTSPLPDRYRKNFEGLDFFEPNENYVVNAFLERTPNAEPLYLETNTDRKSLEKPFGILHFTLNNVQHQLTVYQSMELLEEEGYESYLFLPFLDETNGSETYGGGRYIDLNIPEGDSLELDFNRAYNPYCVYNKKYSCPLVPRQNYLKTKVRAGVKDFKGY